MEGPYYLDRARVRGDITEGKPGVPLRLALRVTDADPSCTPIAKAVVDVWHCDALGIYSGYAGAAVAPTHVQPVDDKTFLRGTQPTDAAGDAQFRTIYPGWATAIWRQPRSPCRRHERKTPQADQKGPDARRRRRGD
jgi:protocatechuate 3,4-dioxygenase beta subunit